MFDNHENNFIGEMVNTLSATIPVARIAVVFEVANACKRLAVFRTQTGHFKSRAGLARGQQ